MAAQKTNVEITRVARLLAVSRQGYYQWAKVLGQPPGPQAARRAEIDARVCALGSGL